jgi:hypothetical protein
MENEIQEEFITSESASYSDSGYNSESDCESDCENEDDTESIEELEYQTVTFVNGSILEEYSEDDPCLLCGRGPFCELEYHLVPFCGCGKAWYHPACTIKCLRIAYGQPYFVPMICPFCHPKKQK